MSRKKVSIHWFRRDLRLQDNHGLFQALRDHGPVIPLFIFDTSILEKLEDPADRRVDFIHQTLSDMQRALVALGSSLLIKHGVPMEVWEKILDEFEVTTVTMANDHEPYGRDRDARITALLEAKGVQVGSYKDINIFERSEVLKADGSPYTVYTPYQRKWRSQLDPRMLAPFASEEHLNAFWKSEPLAFPELTELGFRTTDLRIPPTEVAGDLLDRYAEDRDHPEREGSSRLGVHLRFGTVSIRQLMREAFQRSPVFVNELIWREFFMQILWHFPHPERAFKAKYDRIIWRKDELGFQAWCEGRTGYPLVDAGMRELRATGLMHNRVRMVTASFLCKHLLIDWRWGEAWFAAHLLDYELSSNNGNWQWVAGTGCDAAPYFRIFNPTAQQKRFDPALNYVKNWVKEYGSANYAPALVVHEEARLRALRTYKSALDVRVPFLNDQPNRTV